MATTTPRGKKHQPKVGPRATGKRPVAERKLPEIPKELQSLTKDVVKARCPPRRLESFPGESRGRGQGDTGGGPQNQRSYPDEIWRAIEKDYLYTTMSLRELAERHGGPSAQAIAVRAKSRGWGERSRSIVSRARDAADKIMAEDDASMLLAAVGADPQPVDGRGTALSQAERTQLAAKRLEDDTAERLRVAPEHPAPEELEAAGVVVEVLPAEEGGETALVEATARMQVAVRRAHRADIAVARRTVTTMLAEVAHQTSGLAAFEAAVKDAIVTGDPLKAEAIQRAISLPSRATVASKLTVALEKLVDLERVAYGIDDSGRNNQNGKGSVDALLLRLGSQTAGGEEE